MVGKGKPEPTTPKNSILNYFAKTPKPTASPVSSSSGPSTSTATKSPSKSNGASKASPGTHTGRRISSMSTSNSSNTSNNNTTPKKRPVSSDTSPSGDSSKPKRLKIESPQVSPGAGGAGSKGFVEGDLVWAKLEGYPWWPAMVRGPNLGQPFMRKGKSEFHVQFFDSPPSRAWIRKADIKPYHGCADDSITPARSDPAWVISCKSADGAMSLSPSKRIERYWVTFPPNEEDEEAEEDFNGNNQTPKKTGINHKKPSSAEPKASSVTTLTSSKRKRLHRVRPIIESSDEEDTKTKSKFMSEKSDDEYVPPDSADATMESEKENSAVSSDEVESVIEEDSAESEEEVKKTPRSRLSKKLSENSSSRKSTDDSPASSSKTPAFKNRLLQFSNSPSPSPGPSTNNAPQFNGNADNGSVRIDEIGSWPHLKYKWLQKDQIRDANKRRLNDPDYDPRTLYVPKDFLDALTPAVRQWWDFKSQHFDTILFFKLGKFYELYNMDAVIAVQELGFNFMKGETAHCGFPEIGYSRYSSILIQNGHKVARLEQTETPDMMTERLKKTKFKTTKFDKVVKREICQITTKGIRIPSIQDDTSNPFQPGSEYLYAIVEKVQFNARTEYGVCFIDTSVGTFYIGQFTDDRNCSRLRTLFSHYVPTQILYEKNRTSSNLQELFNNLGSNVRKDALLPETEFWSGSKVLKFLAEGPYFSQNGEVFDSALDWPDNLHNLLCRNDSLNLTPDSKWTLGLSSFGAIVWYLKECLVEHDVLSLKEFEVYVPVDMLDHEESSEDTVDNSIPRNKFQVLDGITLRNLGITHGPNSLLSILDKCNTNFGKRLLRHWLCTPLAVPGQISERLNAVEDLLNNPEIRETIMPLLKSLQKVDLERLLTKVHTLGSLHRSKTHPDSRAFMFDDKIYSKRRIENLTSILKNFKICSHIIEELRAISTGKIKSNILLKLISEYPDLTELFEFFDNAFDHKLASAEGKIIPADGVDPEYDEAKGAIYEIEVDAQDYLKHIQSQLKTRVTYFGNDKKRYQLEVPDKTHVPHKFEMSSNKKGFKRYVTPETKEFLNRTLAAETNRDNVLKDITRRIFEQFDKHRDLWSKAVSTISTLDVLLSLSIFSNLESMTRPKVVYSSQPFHIIENGRHPCISQDTYIPNDTNFGSESKGNFLLLTGPNMGGKSTLMRQIGLITILAHMGCYVPATRCEMSVVDRIFTRLGANDNISEGESTFFVELSETSSILSHSTSHSLILIDELGRGTSTYDGVAIAYAVACKLAQRNCRTIFSTHYHALVESVQDFPAVQLGHMACMVENENEDDPTQETITFLYKITPGQCPKSYGFNAAKLAGIDPLIIKTAYRKAKELEQSVQKLENFRKICSDISLAQCKLD